MKIESTHVNHTIYPHFQSCSAVSKSNKIKDTLSSASLDLQPKLESPKEERKSTFKTRAAVISVLVLPPVIIYLVLKAFGLSTGTAGAAAGTVFGLTAGGMAAVAVCATIATVICAIAFVYLLKFLLDIFWRRSN